MTAIQTNHNRHLKSRWYDGQRLQRSTPNMFLWSEYILPGSLGVNRNRHVHCCKISRQEKLLSSSLGIQTGWCIAEVISCLLDVHLFSAVCRSGVEIKITGRMEMGRLSSAWQDALLQEKQRTWCVADRFLTNEILELDVIPLSFLRVVLFQLFLPCLDSKFPDAYRSNTFDQNYCFANYLTYKWTIRVEVNILKPGQRKPKLSAWLHTTRSKWENMYHRWLTNVCMPVAVI